MSTWAWEKTEPVEEFTAPVGEYLEDETVIFDVPGDGGEGAASADEPAAPDSCSVALIGDSTVACTYFPPASRPENHLLVRMRQAFPDQRFQVRNLARDEEAEPDPAHLEPLFAAVPHLHLAFLRYNIREIEPEAFQAYLNGLKGCCDALRQRYPGVTVLLETGIWIHHPAHFVREANAHLGSPYEAMKAWAIEVGYPVVDIYQKMQAEAGKGNWDLRVRGLPTYEQTVIDDSFDSFFGDEPLFFANMHPNSRCLALIADWEVALLKLLARKP